MFSGVLHFSSQSNDDMNILCFLSKGCSQNKDPISVQYLRCQLFRSRIRCPDWWTEYLKSRHSLWLWQQVTKSSISNSWHQALPMNSLYISSVYHFSINPEIDVGQVHGAFVMGVGYCFTEKTKYDPETGQNLTDGTWVRVKDLIDFPTLLLNRHTHL